MTATVQIDGCLLEVGDPAGTLVSQPPPVGAPVKPVLGDALKTEGSDPERQERAAATLGDFVDSASEVTEKVERAESLFKTLAAGDFLDPEKLGGEIDTMLDFLERLDRRERWQDELRLARSLAALLALAMRWASLVRSLGLAVKAGEQLADLHAVAWAKHELGTLRLAGGDPVGADADLSEARDLREQLGDEAGLRATNHNLQSLCQQLRNALRDGQLTQRRGLLQGRRRPLALAALALGLLLAGGLAGAAVDGGDDGEPAEIEAVGATGIQSTGGGEPGGGGGTTPGGTDTPEPPEPEPPDPVTLTVATAGRGSGTVTAPDAIDCSSNPEAPGDCEEAVDRGTQIELTASPGTESILTEWSGVDCTAKETTCEVTMDSDRTVTATFFVVVD